MELADLQVFKAVVDAGGVTRAAARLHRVQSNVTTRVRRLEDKLGTPLFHREGKRMHLTEAGRTLLAYAESLLSLAEEARSAVCDDAVRGPLRLGAMESTAAVRLPLPLAEFAGRYPQVRLSLRTGNPGQLAAALLGGEIDAALLAEPQPPGALESVPVFSEELVLVARAGTPAPGRAGAGLDVIVFEQGCPHRRRLEEWLARRGEAPARVLEIGSYPAMLGCVAAGMGISLVPRQVLLTFPQPQLLAVHKLPRGFDRVRTLLAWRRGLRSAKIDALLTLLRPAG